MKRVRVLLIGLAVLVTLLLGCEDNWDGMDRSGEAWTPVPAGTYGRE